MNYIAICASYGSTVIDSLIEHNIVHLRPVGMCSYDIPLHEEAIVTPESACGRIAMTLLLNTISQ